MSSGPKREEDRTSATLPFSYLSMGEDSESALFISYRISAGIVERLRILEYAVIAHISEERRVKHVVARHNEIRLWRIIFKHSASRSGIAGEERIITPNVFIVEPLDRIGIYTQMPIGFKITAISVIREHCGVRRAIAHICSSIGKAVRIRKAIQRIAAYIKDVLPDE